jgi:predicted RNA binding protein with dsRBD fold (UPF0201 family)
MTSSKDEDDEADRADAEDAPESLDALEVAASAPVFPTEDAVVVQRAIANIFPALEFDLAGDQIAARGSGPVALARFRRRLRELHIRDTARSVLRRGIGASAITFKLNKQTAAARVVNFSTEGQPLGDIEVTIGGADPELVVDWLCEIG